MATQIRSIRTTAGFLKNATVDFSPGLTCIIGARGTCKSTIVETIRFVFDVDRDKIGQMIMPQNNPEGDNGSHQGLLAATLGTATARCDVEDNTLEIQNLTIERDSGTEPRIYKEGIKQ